MTPIFKTPKGHMLLTDGKKFYSKNPKEIYAALEVDYQHGTLQDKKFAFDYLFAIKLAGGINQL